MGPNGVASNVVLKTDINETRSTSQISLLEGTRLHKLLIGAEDLGESSGGVSLSGYRRSVLTVATRASKKHRTSPEDQNCFSNIRCV